MRKTTMNYQQLKNIVAMKRQAEKKASDNTDRMRRTAELMDRLTHNLQAKQANEARDRRPTTPCQRSLRRHLTAIKNAADPRTPVERVKDLLDRKVASDPMLRVMKIIGEARARKEAAEVKQEQARTFKLEQAVHSKAPFEKPLEGQENKDEGRSVTFSDGRTVNFPAAHATPVKSASERVKEILACRRASHRQGIDG